MRHSFFLTGAALLILGVAACAGAAESEPAATTAPEPETAAPQPTAVPTQPPTPSPVPAGAETAVPPAPIEPVPLGEAGKTSFYSMTIDNTTIQYGIVLPQNYRPGGSYPVLLALPPGPQTRSMVQAGFDLYWGDAARLDDWVVVSPAAPGTTLYFEGAERLIPEFLDRVAATYPPEGGKFHIAGVSNGGLSAFRIALNHPERFHSLITLPGFPRTDDDFARLDSLTDIPVAMFVGEQDTGWLTEMKRTEQVLSELGGTVSLEIATGEGHVIQSIRGHELFALLNETR